MPVLRIKKNGVWEDIMGGSSSGVGGGDADTLDGKHASEFAAASDVENLKSKIGDTPVSEQIAAAIGAINIPVTSVNGMTGDVVIDIPEGFSGSWNDLEDKPFGEENAVEIINAVVDNTNANNGVNNIYNVYYLGDSILEVGKTYIVDIDGASEPITAVEDYLKSYIYCETSNYQYTIISVSEPKTINVSESNTTLPVSGIYVMTMNDISNMSISEDGSIRCLDESYIPDTIARVSDIPTIPDSLPANGGNADTLDGKHANEFASATDVETLQGLVGEDSVSTQIENAVKDISAGKTLTEHFAEENMVLTALQYGTELPSAGIVGRIFFKKV